MKSSRAWTLAEQQRDELAVAVAQMLPADLAAARKVEHEKYQQAYAIETYHMGEMRKSDALFHVANLPCRGSYLDVGCGRGEMLARAEALGYSPVQGTEVVPALVDGVRVIRGEAHALPFADKSWDVVTLFDVLEHLLPGDDAAVCRELARVARKHIILTANSESSLLPDGTELHINRRSSSDWERLLSAWFSPVSQRVLSCNIQYEVSPMWQIDL